MIKRLRKLFLALQPRSIAPQPIPTRREDPTSPDVPDPVDPLDTLDAVQLLEGVDACQLKEESFPIPTSKGSHFMGRYFRVVVWSIISKWFGNQIVRRIKNALRREH